MNKSEKIVSIGCLSFFIAVILITLSFLTIGIGIGIIATLLIITGLKIDWKTWS